MNFGMIMWNQNLEKKNNWFNERRIRRENNEGVYCIESKNIYLFNRQQRWR